MSDHILLKRHHNEFHKLIPVPLPGITLRHPTLVKSPHTGSALPSRHALLQPVSDELPRKRLYVLTLLRLFPKPHHVHSFVQMMLCHHIKELIPVDIIFFHTQ